METQTSSPAVGFESLGLSASLVQNLSDLGFSSPTPIQTATIPVLLSGDTDFVGLASTGTGKTAAFGLPLVEKISAGSKKPQALILCPTRELALQVSEQIQNFSRVKGLNIATVYGGASYRPQLEALRRGAQIVVATPGRLTDLLDNKYIDLKEVRTVVLDEADEMVSLGFKDDLERILDATEAEGKDRRTWLFSATMSPPVRKIAETYLKKPKSAEIARNAGLSSTIQQVYYAVRTRDKAEVLLRVLQTQENFYGLIFCQTRMDTANVARYLNDNGYPAEAIHGDKTQADRERTIDLLRRGKIKALVATDVAARGLDIKDLTHVINYQLPREVDSYIHRIGRTGRNGQSGIALSFVAPEEVRLLHRIQSVTKVRLEQGDVPSAKSVVGFRLEQVKSKLVETLEAKRAYEKAKFLFESTEVPESLSGLQPKEFLYLLIASHYPETLFAREFERISYDMPSRGGGGRGRPRGEDRGERSGRGERFGRGGDRGDRGDRGPRRSFDRGEGRSARGERPERGERFERGERPSRPSRFGGRGGDGGMPSFGGARGGKRSEGRRFDRYPRT